VAKWARAGAEIGLIVLTDGSKGSHDPDLEDDLVRDTREREQREAAARLGVRDVRFLRQVDGELRRSDAVIEAITAAIRQTTPEVVLTHDPWRRYDMHPDHVVAGEIVVRALYAAREPRAARSLAARGLAPWRPSELLLFGAEEPDHLEDVTAVFDAKLDALLCHRSQYGSSFGIADDGTGRDAFVAAVRAYAAATAAAAPGGAAELGESFRRIWLARHTS
jgi:LmbE family N-acetylglucosaminyl deacetylase